MSNENNKPTYRIYVASLSDYNAAILHGIWVDIDENTTTNEIEEQVQEMLAQSPYTKKYGEIAEEWAIHDYELPFEIGEYEAFDAIITQTQFYITHGEAWAAYVYLVGEKYANEKDFNNNYIDYWGSLEEFAYDYVNECALLDGVPEYLQSYFDYEKWGRDMLIGDVMEHKGHYFYRH